MIHWIVCNLISAVFQKNRSDLNIISLHYSNAWMDADAKYGNASLFVCQQLHLFQQEVMNLKLLRCRKTVAKYVFLGYHSRTFNNLMLSQREAIRETYIVDSAIYKINMFCMFTYKMYIHYRYAILSHGSNMIFSTFYLFSF